MSRKETDNHALNETV